MPGPLAQQQLTSPYLQGRAHRKSKEQRHESLTNPQRPRHHVGIDVSKERLDVCLMPEGEAFAVANDQEGIDSLLEHLQEEVLHPELVVLEASGRYERPAAAAIAAAAIPVAVVNPRQARD